MNKKLSTAEEKLLLQYESVVKTDRFKKVILLTRARAGLPSVGFPVTDRDRKNLWQLEYFPSAIREGKVKVQKNFRNIIDEGIDSAIELLSVDNLYFRNLIKNYLYFNESFFEDAWIEYLALDGDSLCSIVDAQHEFDEYISDYGDADERHDYVSAIQKKLRFYPLVLRIHPDASIRDIKNFVETKSNIIRAIQSSYRIGNTPTVKNSKRKVNETVSKRNELIYQSRSFPRKTIAKMLREKGYEPPDVGTIGKIISLEKKKREMK